MVARMAATGDLAPDSFINPSLPLYAMLPFVWAQSRLAEAGLLGGRAADPLLAARALSALAGAGAVLVLAMAVRRAHPQLGLRPALLLAVTPGFVNLCHFATPEPWLLLGTCATLAAAVGHARGSVPAWVLGLLLGLTLSTKYTAVALAAPVLAALWLRPAASAETTTPGARLRATFATLGLILAVAGLALGGGPGRAIAAGLHLRDARLLNPEHALSFVRALGIAALAAGALLAVAGSLAGAGRRWVDGLVRRDTLVALASSGAAFLATTPYAVARPVAFLSDLAFNHQTRFEYKGLASSSSSYGAYLGLLSDALTAPALIAALAGLAAALAGSFRRDRVAPVLLAAAVAPYLLVASGGHQALRFLAPAFPPLAWLAVAGLSALPPRMAGAGFVLVAARAALGGLLVVRLFFVDSRNAATDWLARNVPPGTTVDLIANNPGYAPRAPEGQPFRVVPVLSREMAPADRFAEAAARYRGEASPWLVLTASYYERFLDHPAQAPERAAFFRDLLEGRGGFEVVARFRQQGWRRPNAEFLDPEIVVLRRRD